MSIIQGNSKTSAAGYTIDQSIRFNDNDSAYLYRTPGSDGDTTAFTISAWVKRANITSLMNIYCGYDSGGPASGELRLNGSALQFYDNNGTGNGLLTNALFRDPSAWYHIVAVWDTDNATSTDRLRLYVNGERITSFSSSTYPASGYATTYFNRAAYQQRIGYTPSGGGTYSDCYMAEYHFIDGQSLDASSFGEVNSDTGQWIAKEYSGSYGTNGFYITGETASDLGEDFSGNNNDWTSSGLAATDQVTDTPTDNFCTFNSVTGQAQTLSEGNLKSTISASQGVSLGTVAVTSGKWYWEVTNGNTNAGGSRKVIGIVDVDNFIITSGEYFVDDAYGWGYVENGTKENNNSQSAYGSVFDTAGKIVGVALDLDNGAIWFSNDGTWQNSATVGEIETGTTTNAAFTSLSGRFVPAYSDFSGNATVNFGQSAFTHTPPTGFVALSTAALPAPTIVDPSAYFQPTLYAGNGTAIGSGGLEVNQSENSTFQPDLVWIKQRGSPSTSHEVFDAVRGATKDLNTNTTEEETTFPEKLTSFDADGFTVGNNGNVNTLSKDYVAWQWKEGTTPGFDIVSYSGTGVNRTVAHNLGVKPGMFIVKQRGAAGTNWGVYHSAVGATKSLFLQSSGTAFDSAEYFNDTEPTSSVFTLGTNAQGNANGGTYIAYVFAPVEGFSSFGSYVGTANANGPMINLGFKPAWVMIKQADTSSRDWIIQDATRNPYNVTNLQLLPNTSQAEATTFFSQSAEIDILSNGFKVRSSAARVSESGATYVFAAFAEAPLKTANAR